MRQLTLIGATVALLMFSTTTAFSQQDDQNKQDKHGKQGKDQKKNEGQPDKAQNNGQARKQEREQAGQQAQQQQAAQQAQQQMQQQALQNQQSQQQRVAEQQQRTSQYQANLDQQLRAAQEHATQLHQQNRTSQMLIQQQYANRLHQQQLQVQSDRSFDYGRDAQFNAPSTYRYNVGGNARRTNQHGAALLKQAVNYGYQEGFRAGRADRRDRWGYKSQSSFAYRDANYGYTGRYVEQSDYNYYFRDGFRKGYDDGYYSRARYGRQVNGNFVVLNVVLSGILKLQIVR